MASKTPMTETPAVETPAEETPAAETSASETPPPETLASEAPASSEIPATTQQCRCKPYYYPCQIFNNHAKDKLEGPLWVAALKHCFREKNGFRRDLEASLEAANRPRTPGVKDWIGLHVGRCGNPILC
ncbi:hypothetical protein QBC44DRAFT_305587 [Cladorrhinum sp. PSN332]|nr:hypothetical protein QBC44DRAFT_305587 [Cladorrhinum sp. PSN332]